MVFDNLEKGKFLYIIHQEITSIYIYTSGE